MRLLACVATAAFVAASPAAAQENPDPPGPYVLDVRYATSGVPQDAAFLPPLAPDSAIPTRGTGLEIGAHVYFGRLGPARLGFGASLLNVRGREVATAIDLRSVTPQVSFNFGTREGWSYLSVGAGYSDAIAKATDVGSLRREIDRVLTIVAGGGARWFLTGHIGVGFDLRLRRLSAKDVVPSTTSFGASVGLSLR